MVASRNSNYVDAGTPRIGASHGADYRHVPIIVGQQPFDDLSLLAAHDEDDESAASAVSRRPRQLRSQIDRADGVLNNRPADIGSDADE